MPEHTNVKTQQQANYFNKNGQQGRVEKTQRTEEHRSSNQGQQPGAQSTEVNKNQQTIEKHEHRSSSGQQNGGLEQTNRQVHETNNKKIEEFTVSRDVPSNPNSIEAQKLDQQRIEADKMAAHFRGQQQLADKVLDDKSDTLAGVEADLEAKARILAETKANAAEAEKRQVNELHQLEAKTMQLAEKLEEKQQIVKEDEHRRALEVAELEREARRLADELAAKATQERKHAELMVQKLALDESVARKKAEELAKNQQQEKKKIIITTEDLTKKVEVSTKRVEELTGKHGQQQQEIDIMKKEFEDTKGIAEQAGDVAKKLSDERHETELRLQELIKSEEEARKQADFLGSRQAKERNAIQAKAQILADLQTQLETAQRQLTQDKEFKQTTEVQVQQKGVNEEEAIRKANQLAQQQAEEKRAAEARLKVLLEEEAEALRKVVEVKANMTQGNIEVDERTKIDVFQHTHYDTQDGISASTARVVSGDKQVNVDHSVETKESGGIIGNMLKSLF